MSFAIGDPCGAQCAGHTARRFVSYCIYYSYYYQADTSKGKHFLHIVVFIFDVLDVVDITTYVSTGRAALHWASV